MRGLIPCRLHAKRSKKAIYIYTAGYYRRSIRQQGEPKACSCPLMQVSLHLHISDITGSIRSRPRLSEEWGREGWGELGLRVGIGTAWFIIAWHGQIRACTF